MRRLTEILAFPKAWYRRTIVRRMFLGDLGDTTIAADVARSSSPERQPAADGSAGSQLTPARSPIGSGAEVRPRPSKLHVLQRRLSLDPVLPPTGNSVNVPSSWETLVLFAVNFTKLNVHMNMGNVMGNVTWQTNGFTSEGRLSIGSTGHKNMFISLGLGGSSLEAKGGIVGGNVEVGKIDTYLRILEDPGVEPSHTVGLRLQTLELRLDYMGTSVLMGRVSALDATLRDEWRITAQMADNEAEGTKRPAMIFIHTEVSWDQMQLMISKSTTTDLIKMYSKLEEFFLQQFQSSRRVLIGLNERPSSSKSASLRRRTTKHRRLTEVLQETAQQQSDTRHHRHWHDALRLVAGLKLKTFMTRLPPSGTVLGGTIEMRGQTISLACFHGLNFKSKSWALFSLREPNISFSTESQEIETGVPPDVHVVETLSISLGLLSHQPTARHVSMATVCRVTRTILFPPQFRTMQEWFHYTFSTSELDEVDRFPSLERPAADGAGSGERRQSRSGQASPPPQTPRLHDHNHTAEIVFALPPMQMHLKTEHTQTGAEPDMAAPKPVVVCSFVTEFEDHIFVTTDAENFFFLHDLIDTYISRQPDGAGRSRASDKQPSKNRPDPTPSVPAMAAAANGVAAAARPSASLTASDGEHKVNDPTQMLQQDWREFECRTWHLEPTVRLLSWAGRRIEPYGVDFILNKLGFRHARSTIPKWLQRGSMDPLDKVLAVLVEKTVQVTREGH
ncbi:transmembrane protein KIAA1109 homolog [Pollicipes pollicipes]|uniref:transmembrane protein KIAA1109 homolog n=1 Tax=Pollicipes pollicipes TaxID=41117 RepID=UPI001884966E|nr:transmembrane protein KIAA1109 homolog [Pollicipes pollicipes]